MKAYRGAVQQGAVFTSGNDVTRELGALWRRLPQAAKNKYREEARLFNTAENARREEERANLPILASGTSAAIPIQADDGEHATHLHLQDEELEEAQEPVCPDVVDCHLLCTAIDAFSGTAYEADIHGPAARNLDKIPIVAHIIYVKCASDSPDILPILILPSLALAVHHSPDLSAASINRSDSGLPKDFSDPDDLLADIAPELLDIDGPGCFDALDDLDQIAESLGLASCCYQ